MMLYKKLLDIKGLELVNEDYPFVFKEMFPGSLSPHKKEVKLPKALAKLMPSEANFYSRGDAFVFLTIFSRWSCLPGILMAMAKFYGTGMFTNPKVGLLNNVKWDKREIEDINMVLVNKETTA